MKNDLGEGEKMDDGEGVDFFLFGNGSTPPVLVELYKTKEVQLFFIWFGVSKLKDLTSQVVTDN